MKININLIVKKKYFFTVEDISPSIGQQFFEMYTKLYKSQVKKNKMTESPNADQAKPVE